MLHVVLSQLCWCAGAGWNLHVSKLWNARFILMAFSPTVSHPHSYIILINKFLKKGAIEGMWSALHASAGGNDFSLVKYPTTQLYDWPVNRPRPFSHYCQSVWRPQWLDFASKIKEVFHHHQYFLLHWLLKCCPAPQQYRKGILPLMYCGLRQQCKYL